MLDSIDHAGLSRAIQQLIARSEAQWCGLSEFRREAAAAKLTCEERYTIIEQASLLIDELYAHLPLKQASHGIDPVRQLERLAHAVADLGPAMTEREFHDRMIDLFNELKDGHTHYGVPQPYRSAVAFLPFVIEDCVDEDSGQRKYLVTRVLSGLEDPHFRPGVRVVSWNYGLIDEVVREAARNDEGANRPAQQAVGLAHMTVRHLRFSKMPPGDQVRLEYLVPGEDTPRAITMPWLLRRPAPPKPAETKVAGPAPAMAIDRTDAAHLPEDDLEAGLNGRNQLVHAWRCELFAEGELQGAATKKKGLMATAFGEAQTLAKGERLLEPDEAVATATRGLVCRASILQDEGREYGYLRLRRFPFPRGEDNFIAHVVGEVSRILDRMPDNGLVIDLRQNGGGFIRLGESLLQLLTPKVIQPEPFQFRATSLTAKICPAPEHREPGLSGTVAEFGDTWGESIRTGLRTGSRYSRAVSITAKTAANYFGQRYFGPTLLLIDAQCYSTSDMFAAGFKDHEIGPVIGIDGRTGAGGGNVWTHTQVRRLLGVAEPRLKPLPQGCEMWMVSRRCVRVGTDNQGRPVEELGVEPDVAHSLTAADLLHGHADLKARACRTLAGLGAAKILLAVESCQQDSDSLNLKLRTQGLVRLDFRINGRPTLSVDIHSGPELSCRVPLMGLKPQCLDIEGFAASEGDLAIARRRQRFD